MAELAVLTCPVCDRSAGYAREPDGLKDAAWDHLGVHRLDESKRAIYAVMMVERSEERPVDAAPTGEWGEERPTQPPA